MEDYQVFESGPDDHGKRLDRIVRTLLSHIPLSRVFRALRTGEILLEGKRVPPSTRVSRGARIHIHRSLLPEREPRQKWEPRALPILLETDHLLILNKPPGAVVHGPGSLTDQVRSYLKDRIPPSLAFTPSPLHRLDRLTSGILVFSRSIHGARWFTRALREGGIEKTYLALLEGTLAEPARWEDLLTREGRRSRPSPHGRPALTDVRPLLAAPTATLALCIIHTGRMHQIRVQAALRGHPLLGDTAYGSTRRIRPVLHAWRLRPLSPSPLFPADGLQAPLPDESETILSRILPGWEDALP
ncbi:RluA family pseudouridine synthase [Spirochaeta thermophila]|uniref:Ribosomal large subunit pseudouridine synthase C n=1 Tax=Winmispira thermophila (strain ATCC 49972 / DSM 6192 / RI 19.B1) TaxID=665571 RepID=E0RPU6_WINT6|nr:RluA family pseudouridine synthase [Spirochaeta thermophila]ADN01410.1 ribosomal large subunit pseudouridine synthase C [Spirochaeta thermophila DSM 6192]